MIRFFRIYGPTSLNHVDSLNLLFGADAAMRQSRRRTIPPAHGNSARLIQLCLLDRSYYRNCEVQPIRLSVTEFDSVKSGTTGRVDGMRKPPERRRGYGPIHATTELVSVGRCSPGGAEKTPPHADKPHGGEPQDATRAWLGTLHRGGKLRDGKLHARNGRVSSILTGRVDGLIPSQARDSRSRLRPN